MPVCRQPIWGSPLLELRNIDAAYGSAKILRGVSFEARPGEIHCLFGRNGAGKSTALKAIMGHVPVHAGSILLKGEEISHLPAWQIPALGIGYVPQGRRLFGELSVAENLEIGLMARKSGRGALDAALDLFPRLRERFGQRADTLSGGEQQMLAIARALCIEPLVLLLDEPTEGLQPSMIELIRDVIARLRESGTALVLVEQRVEAVLPLADRITFLENGRSSETVTPDLLRDDPSMLERYLGV